MIEVGLNISSGFILSWIVTLWVLPWYGHEVSHQGAAEMTMIFTVVSIIRSYFWRRVFNRFDCLRQKVAPPVERC